MILMVIASLASTSSNLESLKFRQVIYKLYNTASAIIELQENVDLYDA